MIAPLVCQPNVDVIVISLDRPHETIECIRSALQQIGVSVHVYLVDQGSARENIALLEEFIAEVENVCLKQLGYNCGPAEGRNIAATMGSSETIVGIDNDAELEDPTALARAFALLQADPTLGVIGFRILNHYSGHDDWGSWCYTDSRKSMASQSFYAVEFCACGFAIRRSVFEGVNGFEKSLFIMGEEIDLSYRVLNAGFSIRYVPEIRVRHKVSPERRVTWRSGRFYYVVRNSLYFQYKSQVPKCQILLSAAAWISKGTYNGLLWSALRGVVDAALMSIRFARSRAQRSAYVLQPHAKSYIEAHAPVNRAGFLARVRRQFVGLTDHH